MLSLHLDPESIETEASPEQTESKIPLNTGSPDFGVPEVVRQAVKRRVDAPPVRLPYPPTDGERSTRELIARFERTHLGIERDPSQLIITYGAMQAVFNTIKALTTGPCKQVLMPTPQWFQFPHVVKLAGAEAKCIRTDATTQFKITAESLERAITRSSRVLILTNPGNPVGSEYTRAELLELAAVIDKHDGLMVISDEVYNMVRIGSPNKLAPATSLASIPCVADRVYTVNSLSKNYAMSGLRVGYISAPSPRLRDELFFTQRFSTLGVNVYSQAGARAAYSNASRIISSIVAQLEVRLRKANVLMTELLPKLSYTPPTFGYYLWTDVSAYFGRYTPEGKKVETDEQLRDYLAKSVAVVAGTPCGTPGYFRLTFAIDEAQFATGVREMRRMLDDLTC